MPDPVCLLSSATIQKAEFIAFVRSLQIAGTRVVVNPSEYYNAQLVREKQNIWITTPALVLL